MVPPPGGSAVSGRDARQLHSAAVGPTSMTTASREEGGIIRHNFIQLCGRRDRLCLARFLETNPAHKPMYPYCLAGGCAAKCWRIRCRASSTEVVPSKSICCSPMLSHWKWTWASTKSRRDGAATQVEPFATRFEQTLSWHHRRYHKAKNLPSRMARAVVVGWAGIHGVDTAVCQNKISRHNKLLVRNSVGV